MNIKLSKLYKISGQNSHDSLSCSLLDFGMFKQQVIYRKRSLSRRGSNNSERSKSTSGLRLVKTLDNTEFSTKSNSIKQIQKQQPTNSKQEVKAKINQNPQNLAPRPITFKQQMNDMRRRQSRDFHGSWGIPKYSKQSPTKIMFEYKPVKGSTKQKMPQFFNLKFQGVCSKYTQPSLISPSKSTTCRTIQNQSERQKGLSSALFKGNEQIQMKLSGRSVQKSITLTPAQSQTFLIPSTPQIQAKKNLMSLLPSTHSGMHTSISSLQPIEDLQDVREVRSHYSRELNGSKMHEKGLNQSLVIATDFNSEGFWN